MQIDKQAKAFFKHYFPKKTRSKIEKFFRSYSAQDWAHGSVATVILCLVIFASYHYSDYWNRAQADVVHWVTANTNWKALQYQETDTGLTVRPADGTLNLTQDRATTTHSTDASFGATGSDLNPVSGTNRISVIANTVQLGRSAGVGGGVTLQAISGNADADNTEANTVVTKDVYGGVHVIYFDPSTKAVVYRHSADAAQWDPVKKVVLPYVDNFPAATSYPGSVSNLTMVMDSKRIWVAYTLITGLSRRNIMLGYCDFADGTVLNASGNRCEDFSSKWNFRVFDSASSGAFAHFNQLAITYTGSTERLHIIFASGESYAYTYCDPTGTNNYCTATAANGGSTPTELQRELRATAVQGFSGWSNAAYVPNFGGSGAQVLDLRMYVAPTTNKAQPFGDKIHYIYQVGKGNVSEGIYYIGCVGHCLAGGRGTGKTLAANIGPLDRQTGLDFRAVAKSADIYRIFLVYEKAGMLNTVTQQYTFSTDTIAADSLPGLSNSYSTHAMTGANSVALQNEIAVEFKPISLLPIVVFRSVTSKLFYAEYQQTPLDWNNQADLAFRCPGIGLVEVAPKNWKCTQVEDGGYGLDATLLSDALPAVSHYSSWTNGNLRYLTVPFAPTGTYTSPPINATLDATWQHVKMTVRLPTGSSIALRMRTMSSASTQTDPNQYCTVANLPAYLSGIDVSTGYFIYDLDVGAVTSGCSKVYAGAQYFQYQITMNAVAGGVDTPILTNFNIGYLKFSRTGYLISQSYQMVGGSGPVIRRITWDQIIPHNSSAGVNIEMRAASTQVGLNAASWIQVGYNKYATSTLLAGCTNGRTFLPSNTYSDGATPGNVTSRVVCNVSDPALQQSSVSWIQYKITLSSSGDYSPLVYKVDVEYASNNSPIITTASAQQESNTTNLTDIGKVNISYSLYDPDSLDSSFTASLFYDVGLTLSQDVLVGATSIDIAKPAGLDTTDLSTILPPEGVILIDDEMIEYRYVGGSYVSGRFGAPLVRGSDNTVVAAHQLVDTGGSPRIVPVLIRATDPAMATRFGRPSAVTGTGIGTVTCSGHSAGTACAKQIQWAPVSASSRDFFQAYLVSPKIYVVVHDGQLVKPVGKNSAILGTGLDTQPPSFSQANPFTISTNANVINIPGLGYKAKVNNPSVTVGPLNTSVPDGSGNKMAWCVSGATCGNPTGAQFFGASLPSGWSPSPTLLFGSSLTGLQILTLPSQLQAIRLGVFDTRGNTTFKDSDSIVYDNVAPPDPQNFVGRDVSSSLGERSVYLEWSLPSSAWTGKTDAFLGGTRKDFDKFIIYRDKSTCGAPVSGFCEIASLSSSAATSYIDKNSLADDTYVYKIVTQDDVGNISSAVVSAPSSSVAVSLNGGPRITPSIQNVRIKPVTKYDDPVVILWDTVDANANSTPVPSDSYVAYLQGTTPPTDFSNAPTQGISTLASTGTEDANGTCTCHKVNLIGLTPGNQYYFELRSIAGTEVGKYKSASLTVTIPAAPQAVTPTFTNVQVPEANRKSNSAEITWNTVDGNGVALDGDSFVEYGTSASLGSYYGQKDSVSTHSVVLPSNLTPGTPYFYRVHTTPGLANSAEGVYPPINQSPLTFPTKDAALNDTQGPVITNITVPDQAKQQNTAQVWFTTDEDATGFIEFWTGSEAHRIYPATPEIATKNHTLQLPLDLQPSTSYSFKVIAYDTVNPPNRTETQDQQPFTTLAPSAIPAPAIQNLHFDPPTPNSVTIYWDTPDASSDSAVFFSKDVNTFDLGPQSNPLMTKDHVVTLVGLTPGSIYYFKVQSKNANSDVAQSSTCGGAECRLTTPLAPNPAPTLVPGSISVAPSTFSATISWQTQGSGNSLVQFGTGLNNGIPVYGRTFGSFSANTTSHTVVLPNDLLDGQIYHFRVITVDSSNQIMRYPLGDPDPTDAQCTSDRYNCQDPTFTTDASAYTQALEIKDPLKITNVAPLLVADDMAVIGWSTNRAADSNVDFGVGQPCCEHIEDKYKKADGTTNFQALTRSHAVTLTNLQPKTTYTYKVGSIDPITDTQESVETTGAGEALTFTTNSGKKEGDITVVEVCPGCIPEDQLDFTAPILTKIAVKDITPNTATVTWDTDEDASSIAQYGETSEFGELSGSYDLARGHSVKVKNLTGGTDYMLIAVSYDASGNRGESDIIKFTTTGTKADKPKDEEDKVDESKDKDAKDTKDLSDLQKLSVEKILDILKGLSDDDAAAILQQLGLQLVAPPTFTGGKPSVDVTQTTATISWNTDKDADSRVAYIIGVDYNEKKDSPYALEVGDTEHFVKKHEVIIPNLEPGTLYHYQIRSRERAGRTAYAPDRTFRTSPIKPDIAKAQVVSVSEHTATFVWKTNVPTKTVIEYTNQCKKGASSCSEQKLSQGDSQLLKAHQFTLKDLISDTDYTATIRSEDENELVNLSKPIKFRTGKDATAPELSQIRTKLSLSPGKEDAVQAVISWKTSELSDTQIFYAEGVKKDDLLTKGEASQLQVDMTTNHVVVLNKLRPATVYRFKAVSKDPSGNMGASKEFKIITPRKEESVLELIIRNFEEAFGFLKGGK